MILVIFIAVAIALIALLLRFRRPPAIYWLFGVSVILALVWNAYILRSCSGDCNIRVDLILVAPVLLLAAMLSIIACFNQRQDRAKR